LDFPTLREEETPMKKNTTKNQQQTRRLSLNRETLRLLTEPALLEFVKGGGTTIIPTVTGESTSQNSVPC
jgi:hypothetical protein